MVSIRFHDIWYIQPYDYQGVCATIPLDVCNAIQEANKTYVSYANNVGLLWGGGSTGKGSEAYKILSVRPTMLSQSNISATRGAVIPMAATAYTFDSYRGVMMQLDASKAQTSYYWG